MILTQRPSPNKKSRGGHAITVIVVHATAGELEGALETMCDPKEAKSAHYCIGRKGNVVQLVQEADQAFHAGVSKWNGLEVVNEHTGNPSLNPVSIGIEIVNLNDGVDPYTPEQLASLSALTNAIMADYGVKPENIVRHLDIAPGRKDDPKGFPWEDWKASL